MIESASTTSLEELRKASGWKKKLRWWTCERAEKIITEGTLMKSFGGGMCCEFKASRDRSIQSRGEKCENEENFPKKIFRRRLLIANLRNVYDSAEENFPPIRRRFSYFSHHVSGAATSANLTGFCLVRGDRAAARSLSLSGGLASRDEVCASQPSVQGVTDSELESINGKLFLSGL